MFKISSVLVLLSAGLLDLELTDGDLMCCDWGVPDVPAEDGGDRDDGLRLLLQSGASLPLAVGCAGGSRCTILLDRFPCVLRDWVVSLALWAVWLRVTGLVRGVSPANEPEETEESDKLTNFFFLLNCFPFLSCCPSRFGISDNVS